MHLRTLLSGIAACGMAFAGASAALAYSVNDASYVTTSRNPTVLQYVVCLEGVVEQVPRSVSIPDALAVARQSCAPWERQLPRTANEPDASQIIAMITECGFRPGDASPDADCGSAGAGAPVPRAGKPPGTWPPGAAAGKPPGTWPPGAAAGNPPGAWPPGAAAGKPPGAWPPGAAAGNPPSAWPPGAGGGNPTRISPPGGVAGNPPAWAGGGSGSAGHVAARR